MYREKSSLVPILYYNRLPAEVDSDIAIVLEPMIATGAWIGVGMPAQLYGLRRLHVLCVVTTLPPAPQPAPSTLASPS